MNKTIFIGLAIILTGICGCEETISSTPQMPPPIAGCVLLTPQVYNGDEKEAKLDFNYNKIYYNVDYNYIDVQEIGSSTGYSWLGVGPGATVKQLKLYPDYTSGLVVYNDYQLTRVPINGSNRAILSSYGVEGVHPRISPDGHWVAFIGYYGQFIYNPNIYIVDELGEIAGELRQVTNFQEEPYQDISVSPVCWLSSHELVVMKTERNSSDDYRLRLDMLKYDINNLIVPPQLLTTSYDFRYQPLGYDEVVYLPGNFYITNCGDAGFRYANLFKCPLGVAGDYGQQLTFGGNFDVPCDLSPDGTKLLFIRFYRYGSNYLTGTSDIYLMDLNSSELTNLSAKEAQAMRCFR